MKCPFCKAEETAVIDSRESEDGDSVRRRRQCESCEKRFTTYERVELSMPMVVKTSGNRVPYDGEKIRTGFMRALHKRPVPTEYVEQAMSRIEQRVLALGEREVPSRVLGEMVMRELKKMDDVAYLPARGRFPRGDPRGKETEPHAPRREVMFSPADHEFMGQALTLAERGLYTTTPNPRVGCVVVNDGAVVGTGWHEKAGLPHAEILALEAAGARARGATLFLNLEPCSHHGRTPPCADAIVAAGVKRIVAAMQDPNPKVAGAGFAKLRAAGIAVERGLKEDEARELNVGFLARMTRGRPWVRMKIAASLDGRTALANGRSQWITGEAARADGHRWRASA